jgi:hypothetical protein
MRATSATVTWRLLGAKTKPTASAPSSAASCASARFVFAQILIHMVGFSFLEFSTQKDRVNISQFVVREKNGQQQEQIQGFFASLRMTT